MSCVPLLLHTLLHPPYLGFVSKKYCLVSICATCSGTFTACCLQDLAETASRGRDGLTWSLLQAEDAMSAVHRNLRMENQLIVDLIYTFLVRVSPFSAAFHRWDLRTQLPVRGCQQSLVCKA